MVQGFGYIGQKICFWLDKKTNEGRVYTETGRDITQDVMGNSVVLNFDLGTGTYLDADGDGTFFMALEGPTRQLRLWSTSGVAQPLIQLPVGDWVACAMTPTRRYGLKYEWGTWALYSWLFYDGFGIGCGTGAFRFQCAF